VIRDCLPPLTRGKRVTPETLADEEALAQVPLEQRSAVIERADRQIKVSEDANDRYGAFKTGAHDDLATALGLAVQTDGSSVGTVLDVPPEMAALLRRGSWQA
jgi:hypothetical protein